MGLAMAKIPLEIPDPDRDRISCSLWRRHLLTSPDPHVVPVM